MAKKKAAKKAAKSAVAPKGRPTAKKAAKPKAAAKAKAAPKAKAAVKKKVAAKAKPSRAAGPKRPAAKKAAKAPPPRPVPPVDSAERKQAETYVRAVETFQGGKLKRAVSLFETVAEGPDAGLRHRANVHIQICRRRLESDKVVLKTADDYYNFAVKLINDRDLAEARAHLDKALSKASRAGYVHYAKAVVAALSGDRGDAHRSLSRAIDLDPKHRMQARRDPDLAGVRDDAQIAELLHGDTSAADS